MNIFGAKQEQIDDNGKAYELFYKGLNGEPISMGFFNPKVQNKELPLPARFLVARAGSTGIDQEYAGFTVRITGA